MKPAELDQAQKFSILRYVLSKCDVGDLFCQRTMFEEFISEYISCNQDGNQLAKTYIDFTCAVDFLSNIDKEQIKDLNTGRTYLREFCLDNVQHQLYQYPDEESHADDVYSQASSY